MVNWFLGKNRHSDNHLQIGWNCAKLGTLIFPLFPALGAVGLFLAVGDTWRQKYASMISKPLNWGLAILSIWLLITSSLAYNPTEAFLGLGNFLPFLVLFPAFSTLIQTPAQLRQLAWILVIPSLAVTILGFAQMVLGWTSPKLLSLVFGSTLVANGNPPGRMDSVFLYANILAAYLQIPLILGIGLWIERFQGRRWISHRFDYPLLFLSVVVIGNAIALVLTNSRNAWIIAVLACLAFALYLGWYWLVTAVTAAVGSVLWASFGPMLGRQWLRSIVPAYFWMRLSDQLYPDRPIATLRTTQWKFTWSMIQERPWFGWGLRNFTPLYQSQMEVWLGHPHNLPLMLTAETGIPGTLMLSGLVGWIIVQGIQRLRVWSTVASTTTRQDWHQDNLILFSYLVAFGSCTLFNLLDVTLFDFRVNTLGWLLLSAIRGVACHI
ncbi:MAG: polymerase [Moorea sp. SIO3C2]|nr:polymerase [Moorena sp. SIO3C2]